MHDHLRKGFHRFSKGTSVHGFSQLHETKSVFWTAFWTVTIVGALFMTTYQMSEAIRQYIDQPTSTVILTADESEILYPPIRLCYMHWLFWVDWSKAMDTLEMSKDVILFGLSYMHQIQTTVPNFNVSNVQKKFVQFMNRNNLKTVSQFYKLIARKVPIIAENNLTHYFDKIEIIFKKPSYYLFCYTMSQEQVRKYFYDLSFETKSGGKLISFSTLDETYSKLKHVVTRDEYNRVMTRWIQRKSMYNICDSSSVQDFTNFAPPVLLYPNAYNTKAVDVFSENDVYSISMQISARSLKNSGKTPCLERYQSVACNQTCKFSCKAHSWNEACNCQSLDLSSSLHEDQPSRLCKKEIAYLLPNGTEILYPDDISLFYSRQACSQNGNVSMKRADCEQSCIESCTIWSYDINTAITTMASLVRKIGSKNFTNITIDYPYAINVVIMKEINSQTWGNFVGSVGGLLGIWTGASIVSVIQFVYLCCFAECTEWKHCTSFWKNRRRKQIHKVEVSMKV